MVDKQTLLEAINRIKSLAKENRYDEILELISQIEESGYLIPSILVWKGVSIQLSSGKTMFDLDDAEHAFRTVIDIDNRYTESILELAWFLFSIRDNATDAKILFEQALAITRQQLIEAVIGMIRCIFETEGKQHALKYLDESMNSAYSPEDISKLTELRYEIEMDVNGK